MASLISIFNRYSIVKQLPVFSKLNWLELQKIARKSSMAEYKKGEVIRKQGDPPDALYCLVSGRVQARERAARIYLSVSTSDFTAASDLSIIACSSAFRMRASCSFSSGV